MTSLTHPQQQRKIKTKLKPEPSEAPLHSGGDEGLLVGCPVLHRPPCHICPQLLPLTPHSAAASLGSWLVLKQFRHAPASGPLHRDPSAWNTLPSEPSQYPPYLLQVCSDVTFKVRQSLTIIVPNSLSLENTCFLFLSHSLPI